MKTWFITEGVLLACPFGYYFHSMHRSCVLGEKLLKEQTPQNALAVKGSKVSGASPMFISQPCVAPGAVPYPDYRYYITCELPGGSNLYFKQTIRQCPFGLYYNHIHRKCTKASLFSEQQVHSLNKLAYFTSLAYYERSYYEKSKIILISGN